jgi:methylation protein MtfA
MTTTVSASPVAAPAPSVAATDLVKGHLAEIVGELGAGVTVHDMYDPVGSAFYDDISRHDHHEVREILAAIRGVPGEVLDLAAGSGRLTVPMLASGRTVTALELSHTMLDLLRRRLSELPAELRGRAAVVAGDMRTFRLPTVFGAIVLGTTSISLLDEAGRAALFERVREQLAPGGRFLISTLQIAAGAATDARSEVTGASGRTYRLHERFDPAAGIRSVVIHPTTVDGDQHVCTSAVRIIRPDLLAAELHRQGLRIEQSRALPTGSDRYRDALLTVGHIDQGGRR